jgi:hypothetical protein
MGFYRYFLSSFHPQLGFDDLTRRKQGFSNVKYPYFLLSSRLRHLTGIFKLIIECIIYHYYTEYTTHQHVIVTNSMTNLIAWLQVPERGPRRVLIDQVTTRAIL